MTVSPRQKGGRFYYVARATIGGKRIERTFSDATAADGFAAEHNQKLTTTTVVRPQYTRLTREQILDAETAFAALPEWATLTEAVRFHSDHFRPVVSILAAEALAGYRRMLTTQRKNRAITTNQIGIILSHFLRTAKITHTIEITTTKCQEWVYSPTVGSRTQRDRFDHLNRWCAWLADARQKHLFANPMDALFRPNLDDGLPSIIGATELGALLQAAWTDSSGPTMLPFFAVCGMSGVRPDEFRRLREEDFELDEHHLVELTRAKGRKRRNVALCPALVEILLECRERNIPLVHWSKRQFIRIRQDAGLLDGWDNDILRHSYASAHYAVHRNIGELAGNMGNSEDVLFSHYIRRTVKKMDGLAYLETVVDFTQPAREARTRGWQAREAKRKLDLANERVSAA